MPHIDGIEATRRVLAMGHEPPTRVLVLTTFDLNEYVYDALRAGASGFLLKDVPPEQLVAGVHVVARGEALLAPTITKRLIEEFAVKGRVAAPAAPAPEIEELTPRELEVFRLIARGMSNAELADEPVRLGDDGQDPRGADPDEARPARSGAGRRLRLRARRRGARGGRRGLADRTARYVRAVPSLGNLPALEVAIGLAFLFFVLSTACSAVNEGIANLLGWRAKTLEDGVRNLLGDKQAQGA